MVVKKERWTKKTLLAIIVILIILSLTQIANSVDIKDDKIHIILPNESVDNNSDNETMDNIIIKESKEKQEEIIGEVDEVEIEKTPVEEELVLEESLKKEKEQKQSISLKITNRKKETIYENNMVQGLGIQAENEIKYKDLKLKVTKLTPNTEIEIDKLEQIENPYINILQEEIDSFYVKPSQGSEVEITKTARGTELYECNDNKDFCAKKQDLVPGEEYTITASSLDTYNTYAETGVATINTEKTIYLPGEEIELTMVILDKQGNLVADAEDEIQLEIITPEQKKVIIGNIEEESKGVYKAKYHDELQGKYYVRIKIESDRIDYDMYNYFYIQEDPEYTIRRIIPPTIDPWMENLEALIQVSSRTKDDNNITETIPSSFKILQTYPTAQVEENKIIWEDIGENEIIKYIAAVPLITPNLFELGPLIVNDFTDYRLWYLAIDPTGYYDPTTTVTQGWTDGTGNTVAEIDDGTRKPSLPDTNNYVAQSANTNSLSEFGFPTITESNIENITLWVYTGTGSNARYTFYLQQGGTTRCSKSMSVSSATGWYNCTWNSPTGLLNSMTLELGGVTKSGGGKNQNAFVYSAYLEITTGQEPHVTLQYPDNNDVLNISSIDFNFTATDDVDDPLANCTLYGNFTGSWLPNKTITSVSAGTETNITRTVGDGTYIWNVECSDQSGYTNTTASNRTIIVNNQTPSITNYNLNESIINQSEQVYFNTSISDSFGISYAYFTLKYPNGTSVDYPLSNIGDEYYFTILNTNSTGIYNVTRIWVNDTYNRTTEVNPYIYFQVTPSPPTPFNLTSPGNSSISNIQTPTLQWQQSTETHFKNYTILIDNDADFSSVNYRFYTNDITNTSITTSTLASNTQYYWKVIAYDIFENSRNSTYTWIFIIDTIEPTITLNEPGNGDYYLSSSVTFNFTPQDTHLKNCTLYTNQTTAWENQSFNSSPANNQPNYFTETLNDGVYVWNVECYDEATNSKFAAANYSTKIDTQPPNIKLTSPDDNYYENLSNNIVFVYNVSDAMTTVASCELIINNDVKDTNPIITENQPLNFTFFLDNGEHNWSINCTDDNGYENSSLTYNVSVNVTFETDPPVIVPQEPAINNYSQTSNITFRYTPTDATGVENCSIYLDNTLNKSNTSIVNNQQNNFTINEINETTHLWFINCFDNNTQAESNSSSRNFTVDLTNPAIIINSPQTGNLTDHSTTTFNFTPTDTNLDYCEIYANFTGSWIQENINNSPSSGTENIFTETISDGYYAWYISCTDKSKRNNKTNNRTIQVDANAPQITNVTEKPSSPTTYSQSQEYQFNGTITDEFRDTVYIEHNFTTTPTNYTVNASGNVFVYNYTTLAAGTYYYKWYANDSTNKIVNTTQYTYIVSKANPGLNLYLNGAQNNITINEEQNVTVKANLSVNLGGNLTLYQNGQQINSGFSPLTNTTNYTQPGSYNITALHIEDINYSADTKTYFITVMDISDPVVSLVGPENNSTRGNPTVTFQYNVTDKTNIVNCSLYIDNAYDQKDSSVTKNITQIFTKTLADGNYTWKVICEDEYGNIGNSTTYNLTVQESTTLNVTIETDKNSFQIGETIISNTTVKDEFGSDMYLSNVTTHFIKANTTKTWWNTSWKNRRPIIINETSGQNRIDDVIDINISGLSISGCYDEIRIISHNVTTPKEIPYKLYSGDNSTWCRVAFRVNLSASETNNQEYYVYYNNSGGSDPGYDSEMNMDYLYYAQTSAQDEGTVTNPGNIAGFNDGTFAQMSISGGGATQESASGRNFINESRTETILAVYIRYRYEITSCTANWYLRHSTDNGGSYINSYLGSTTQTKTTSSWNDITSDYSALTWADMNQSRLQGRVTKQGGGGGCTMNLYWVQLNVTVRGETQNMNYGFGNEEKIIETNQNQTDLDGMTYWNINTLSKSIGNYTLLSYVENVGFQNSSGYKVIQILPDTTKPKITLNSPVNKYNSSNSNTTFNWTIVDVSGNSTCNISIDESTNQAGLVSYTQTPRTKTINNTPEGNHNWSMQCEDDYGNTNTSETRNFTVDLTAPTINNLLPQNYYNTSNTSIEFNWTPTDALSTITYCTIIIDGQNQTSNLVISNNSFKNITVTNISTGTHTWNLNCTDASGNTNMYVQRQFTIISPPGSVDAKVNQNGSIYLSWSASPEAESYNLYFTNNITVGFLQTPNVTGITDLNYTDSDANLIEEKYYKITSVRSGIEKSASILGKHRQTLASGLNMISSPFNLTNYDLKDASNNGITFNPSNDCIVSLWSYDPSTGYKRTDWVTDRFVPASGDEDFTSLDQTKGYWLETNQSCDITILGRINVENLDVSLQNAYNLAAWPDAEKTKLPTDHEAMIFNTTPSYSVRTLNWYNPAEDKFEVTVHYMDGAVPWGWFPSGSNPNFTHVEAMKAYFVESNTSSTWHFKP